MNLHSSSEDTTRQVHIPEELLRQVLSQVDDLTELKLTLYVFWQLSRKDDPSCYVRVSELEKDTFIIKSLGKEADAAHHAFEQALRQAVARGTLLQAEIPKLGSPEMILCFNSPKGRALIETLQHDELKPSASDLKTPAVNPGFANIFQLYESSIGPLTPMVADVLRDAEKTYPANWIEDAFRIAVDRNKRNWNYIEAILRRWQEGGHDDRKDQQDRRDTEEARRRYGEWEN